MGSGGRAKRDQLVNGGMEIIIDGKILALGSREKFLLTALNFKLKNGGRKKLLLFNPTRPVFSAGVCMFKNMMVGKATASPSPSATPESYSSNESFWRELPVRPRAESSLLHF